MINNKLNKLKWMFAATALTAGLCATEGTNVQNAFNKAADQKANEGNKANIEGKPEKKAIDFSNYIPYLGGEAKLLAAESLDLFLGGRAILNGGFVGVYASAHAFHNYLLENLNFFATGFVGTELSKNYNEKFGGGFLIGASYRINEIFALDFAPGMLFQKGEGSKIILNLSGSYTYDNKYRALVGVSPKFNRPCFEKSEIKADETTKA